MKVCFITTWLPKFCGIATYTGFLSQGLLKNKGISIYVITEKENPPVRSKNINVYPSFDRKTDYTKDVIKKINKIKPDIVHIQHEFGIFGNDFRLIKLLKNIKCPKVVTLHTIASKGQKRKFKDIELFNKQIGKYSNKIIVHQKPDRNVLLRQGLAYKDISVITHGTELSKEIIQKYARKKIGFPAKMKIILLFGFLKKAKLSLQFVNALPSILKNNPDTYMYIVGSTVQSRPKDKNYLKYIKEKLKKKGINKKVVFVNKFIPQNQVPLYYSAADIVVFPYDLKDWGASGSLHLAVGAGKSTVISRIAKFEEIREGISEEIAVMPHHREEWTRVINRILNDKKFRDYIAKKTKKYALKTSWKNIAKQHYELYKLLSKK